MPRRSPRLDPLDIERLHRILRGGQLGVELIYDPEMPSTHELGRSRAESLARGTMILTDRQSEGHGRKGRPWFSPARSGLYWTVVLKECDADPRRLGLFNLLLAQQAAEAIRETEKVRCRLSWPNDLVYEGRKLGGVLVDASTQGNAIRHVIASVGINTAPLDESVPREVAVRATSLHEITGRRADREILAAALASRVEGLWKGLAHLDPERALGSWLDLCPDIPGQRVRARWRGRMVEGTAEGLTAEGLLLLRLDDGESLCIDGELEREDLVGERSG